MKSKIVLFILLCTVFSSTKDVYQYNRKDNLEKFKLFIPSIVVLRKTQSLNSVWPKSDVIYVSLGTHQIAIKNAKKVNYLNLFYQLFSNYIIHNHSNKIRAPSST